jgi:lipopolysaccharide/colanic/teichoic acid biosynthesis glycosyltransferase
LSGETMPEKLKYDLYYIKNLGFLLDMAILLKTVRIVVFGRGR